MRYIFILFLMIFCLFGDTTFAEPKPSFENPRQIIFAITEDSPHELDHVLSVANNVLKFYGIDNVEIEIVAYSQGISLLLKKEKEIAKRVDSLMQNNVTFVACHNTMVTKNIKEDDLIDGSLVVTAGVVELLERVKSGWIYIKP